MAVSPAPTRVPGVAELTRRIQQILNQTLSDVWVRGEVTGFKRADSGILYFSLKEGKDAVLNCIMFSTDAARVRFPIRDGLEFEAYGFIDVYPPQGKYQLRVRGLRPAGEGMLLLAYEELKRRLQMEGLFDAARKQPLPPWPQRIGLVTSAEGAAYRDMVQVLRSRWPSIQIVLDPVRVQGDGAAIEIAEAIRRFNRYGRVDLLIVGRGGGSLEDLWAFNEESVVRAIVASRIPVISAVGHEVDTTLADFAADRRAATPSNAAEIAVRERVEISRRVLALVDRARRSTRGAHAERRRRLLEILRRYGFKEPRGAIDFERQKVDRAWQRVAERTIALLKDGRRRLETTRLRSGLRDVPRGVALRRADADALAERFAASWLDGLDARRSAVRGCGHRLRALSPRHVMERGYCLVRGADGTLLRRALDLSSGDLVRIEFARGDADARVETIRPGDADAEERA